MKLFCLSVRDVKADSFGQPFFSTSIGQAVRSFGDEINRAAQDNILYLHPDDFELFHLGMFDTDNGQFELLGSPEQKAHGSSLKLGPTGPSTGVRGGPPSTL